MVPLLANAAPSTDSNAIILFVFYCILLMAVVLVLAAIPVWIAWRRDPGRSPNAMGVMLIWALLAWGTAVYALHASETWSQTYNQRIMSGYFDASDPNTTRDAPREPWLVWAGVALGYVAMIAWAAWPAEDTERRLL